MNIKSVKDIMLPLSDYPVVSKDATILDALIAMDEAQQKLPPDRQPHRAVLVTDESGKIVGKLGHLGFLKILEPKLGSNKEREKLSRAGVSDDLVDVLLDRTRFWQNDVELLCKGMGKRKVSDAMQAVDEIIDENTSIIEAVHKMLQWQSLSILVTRRGQVVGILRLSDLFTTFADCIKSLGNN